MSRRTWEEVLAIVLCRKDWWRWNISLGFAVFLLAEWHQQNILPFFSHSVCWIHFSHMNGILALTRHEVRLMKYVCVLIYIVWQVKWTQWTNRMIWFCLRVGPGRKPPNQTQECLISGTTNWRLFCLCSIWLLKEACWFYLPDCIRVCKMPGQMFKPDPVR
jgi:hypothetical protein